MSSERLLAGRILDLRLMQFDSAFADALQKRPARRALVVGSLAFIVMLGVPPAWLTWTALSALGDLGLSDGSRWHLIFPASGPWWLAYAALTVLIYFFLLPIWERTLYLAVRFAIPVPGFAFDEHQRSVLEAARAATRPWLVVTTIAAMVLGVVMIVAASQGGFASAPVYVWACITMLLSALMAPLLLLAWRLPDDTLDESEAVV